MSAINLAGFIVYRISPRKPIEYLLLNNSYEHRTHWYPPKGRRNSNEDELKAAVRETFSQTELHSQDYVSDSAFRAELKYVDGIKPKQVVYFLARFVPSPSVTSHLCDGSGLKYQWCTLDQALEKVVFQSMQNILTQAEDYIEGIRDEILTGNSRARWQNDGGDEKRAYRSGNGGGSGDSKLGEQNENGTGTWRTARDDAGGIEGRFNKLSVNDGQRGGHSYGDRDRDHHQQQSAQGQWKEAHGGGGGGGMRDGAGMSQQRRPQDNPLYKTRLCEKFEQDGECPYHQKCVFAHGAAELRVREGAPTGAPRGNADDRQRDHSSPAPAYQRQQQYQQSRQPQQQPVLSSQFQQPTRTLQNPGLKFSSNPLYKTRLCQRYTEQGDCPYGEKCQFAHGDQELRIAPEQPAPMMSPRDNQYPPRTPTGRSPSGFNGGSFYQSQPWKMSSFDSPTERSQAPRLAKNMSWSNTGAVAVSGESPSLSDEGSLEPPPGYPLSSHSAKTAGAADVEVGTAPLAAPLATPVPQKIPAPASAKLATTTKKPQEPKPGSLKSESGGERPWIKVLDVSNEELQHMGSPHADAVPADAAKPKQTSKTAGLESRLAKELIEFFARDGGSSQELTPQAALKEITHVEFRNNLSKQQLLNVCIGALFAPCKGVGVSDIISKHSELLSKIVSKQQDQVLMLNAWLRLLAKDENAAAWQKKAPEILGALYKESLLDEEVFMRWFDRKHAEDRGPAIASMQPFAHWLATAEEE